jgi:DNA-directed RNA polymerase specialized sigma24 family protein
MAQLSDAQARDYYAPMLGFARQLTHGDEDAAADLVQDAFVKVLLWQPASLSVGRMCHLVKCAGISRWRHESRHPWGAPRPLVDWTPGHVAGPESAACDRETLADIMALPGADLLLAEAVGWSHREIAAWSGTTRACVKTRIHRLRHGPLARLSPYR